MTVNEMKRELGDYSKLVARAKRLSAELRLFPEDREFLEPLLRNVSEKTVAINGMINTVCEPDKKEILYRKYILGETFEQIAESMCYSTRHVQRMLNSSIESIAGVSANEQ